MVPATLSPYIDHLVMSYLQSQPHREGEAPSLLGELIWRSALLRSHNTRFIPEKLADTLEDLGCCKLGLAARCDALNLVAQTLTIMTKLEDGTPILAEDTTFNPKRIPPDLFQNFNVRRDFDRFVAMRDTPFKIGS